MAHIGPTTPIRITPTNDASSCSPLRPSFCFRRPHTLCGAPIIIIISPPPPLSRAPLLSPRRGQSPPKPPPPPRPLRFAPKETRLRNVEERGGGWARRMVQRAVSLPPPPPQCHRVKVAPPLPPSLPPGHGREGGRGFRLRLTSPLLLLPFSTFAANYAGSRKEGEKERG